MLHERGSLVLIAVVCLVASPARAQAPDEPRIDLSVVDVPLARAVADVAARGGGSVVVDRRVAEERVTADLRGVTWREAVDVLARLTRSRVEARPSGVLLVGPGTVRVSAAFEDADVRSVLRTLVERFDEPLWVDDRAAGSVTLVLDDVDWPAAVEAVAAAAGLGVARVDSSTLVGPGAPGEGLRARPDRLDIGALVADPVRVSAGGPDVALPALLIDLAAAGGRSLVVGKYLPTTPLGAVFKDLRWDEAMELLLAATDCEVVELPGGVLLVKPRWVLQFDLPEEGPLPLDQLLELTASCGGVNLVVGGSVEGSHAPFMHRLPSDLALDVIARRFGLSSWSDGEVTVVRRGPLDAPPRARAAPDEAGRRVTLRSAGEPLSRALATACAPGRRTVAVTEPEDPPIHAHLVDVPWRLAVAALARAASCAPQEAEGGRLVVGRPVLLKALRAPAAGWFRLLQAVGELELEVALEVGGQVTASLRDVSPARVVELTAWANGNVLELRDGVLHVTGGPPLPLEGAPPPAGARPLRRARRARAAEDPAAQGRAADLLNEIIDRAQALRGEEPLAELPRLRAILAEGPLVREAFRRALEVEAWRLRASLRNTLALELRQADGEAVLRAMSDAIREERFTDVPHLHAQVGALGTDLTARARALRARSDKLEVASRLPLEVTAGASGPRPATLINGVVLRPGDAVLHEGRELTGLRVREAHMWGAHLEYDEYSFGRWVQPW